MQCRTVLTSIDALRTDEVSEGEQRKLNEHFETCSSCHESVEDIRSFASSVQALHVRPPRSILAAVFSALVDHYDVVENGESRVFVAFSDRGARMIGLGNQTFEEFAVAYGRRFDRELVRGTLPPKLREQIVAALEGRGSQQKPLVDVTSLTPFERDVLSILQRIPRGEVRSYAWLAREAGKPRAIRAVGNVMARNPVPLLLPCHRVVPTSGGIGQYAFGAPFKRALLEREGVAVGQLDDLARTRVRFIGSATTHIFCVPTCRDARRIREENRVLFHNENEATEHGFRACLHCRPAA